MVVGLCVIVLNIKIGVIVIVIVGRYSLVMSIYLKWIKSLLLLVNYPIFNHTPTRATENKIYNF